jgi:hypothetical protein
VLLDPEADQRLDWRIRFGNQKGTRAMKNLRGMFLLTAVAALGVFATGLIASPAEAASFTSSCTGGGSSLNCTFTAGTGTLFIDGQSADINVTGTIAGATETVSGGGATTSSFDFNSTSPVDGLGHFTVVDNLIGSPPTASLITIVITGSNLALAPNEFGNVFAGHICDGTGGVCTGTTFFTTPVPAPLIGAGLPGILAMLSGGGLLGLARRRRIRSTAS